MKTPPKQKGILLDQDVKDVGLIYCFVCVINSIEKALRQRRNLFVALRKKAICPSGATCSDAVLVIKIQTDIRL